MSQASARPCRARVRGALDSVPGAALACAAGVAWLVAGCAAKQVSEPPSEPDTSYVLRLVGRFGLGHGCPVNGVILTAGHNVQPFASAARSSLQLVGFSWEDSAGNRGYARGVNVHAARDLGVLHVTSGRPRYYELASQAPELGDAVSWREYDRSRTERAYFGALRWAQLVNSVAGHLVLSRPPTHGASGTCVFDSAGDVVGVVSWRDTLQSGEGVAFVVSVVPPWWPAGIELENRR